MLHAGITFQILNRLLKIAHDLLFELKLYLYRFYAMFDTCI